MFHWTVLLSGVLKSETYLCAKRGILYIRPKVKTYTTQLQTA